VIQLQTEHTLLVTSNTLGVKSLSDLLARAKGGTKPLTYGSGGPGGMGHVTTEYFSSLAGVKLTHVPYRGTSAIVKDVVSGEIDVMMAGVAALAPLSQAGRIQPIAVAAPDRVSSLPDVPTFIEAGLP